MKKKKAPDTVIEVFLKLSRRKYECSELRECLEKYAEDLNRILVRKTNYFCFVEFYTDTKMISVVCGLDMIYVYVDYECGKFKPLVFRLRSLDSGERVGV
jgi:hypothetical protein